MVELVPFEMSGEDELLRMNAILYLNAPPLPRRRNDFIKSKSKKQGPEQELNFKRGVFERRNFGRSFN